MAADIAIVGGGLAGGLIALALKRLRPHLSARLIDGAATLGGNHRWSWFDTDLAADEAALFDTFETTRWNAGYDVRFPRHARTLSAGYRSLTSADFDAGLRRALAQGTVMTGRAVRRLSARTVEFDDGEVLSAGAVIDARGFAPSAHLTGGWQVFMGRHLRLTRPHGLTRPTIMDATVEQLGGYRFVYVLPLGEDALFVEDTYYQDTPALDRAALSARLDAYARARGWRGETEHEETGVLPVVTGGDRAAHLAALATPDVGLAGGRGLLAHPLTSYTLPLAASTALLVAENADLPGPRLAALLDAHGQQVWARTGHYRFLGHLLFDAAQPQERYRVFERFYRLPEDFIERFYAARPRFADKVRVLAGIPPVPVSRALRALATADAPLAKDKDHRA